MQGWGAMVLLVQGGMSSSKRHHESGSGGGGSKASPRKVAKTIPQPGVASKVVKGEVQQLAAEL